MEILYLSVPVEDWYGYEVIDDDDVILNVVRTRDDIEVISKKKLKKKQPTKREYDDMVLESVLFDVGEDRKCKK